MSELYFADFDPAHDGIFRQQLEIARLPTSDLEGLDRLFFRMSDDTSLIGYIGLQGSGPDRLLRSLVVLNSQRGKGYGRKLVDWLEDWCLDGVERLHLLTTKQGPFFHRLGYALADRATAPASIAGTAEFSTLCPANAAYMTKSLN